MMMEVDMLVVHLDALLFGPHLSLVIPVHHYNLSILQVSLAIAGVTCDPFPPPGDLLD